MADILNFNGRTRKPRGIYELSDDSTLETRLGLDPAMPPAPSEPAGVPSARPTFSPGTDWTNQELADLWRVKRLLEAAGVPVELARGVTDEGDPWAAFCDSEGEVFVHLARFDGAYLLAAPRLAEPLRGADFSELIAAYTGVKGERGAPPAGRVVALRGGAVMLHPAAALAALVWSVYLASEEVVIVLPEEDAEAEGDAVAEVEAVATAPMSAIALDARPDGDPGHEAAQLGQKPGETARDLALAGAGMGASISPAGVALGLTVIASAYGFVTQTEVEAAPEAEAEALPPAEDGEELQAEVRIEKHETGDGTERAEDGGSAPAALARMDAETEAAAELPVEAVAEAALDAPTGELPEAIPVAAPAQDVQIAPTEPEAEEAASAEPEAETAPAAPQTTVAQPAVSKAAPAAEAADEPELTTLDDDAVLDLLAGFELWSADEEIVVVTAEAALDETSEDNPWSHIRQSFDEEVEAFADMIREKAGHMVISYEDSIVIVDVAAVSADAEESYVRSWVDDDGTTVSIVGHQSDFADFGLLAA